MNWNALTAGGLALTALLNSGCSGPDSNTSRPEGSDAPAFRIGCEPPAPPQLPDLAPATVGDGTPESCTAQALQQALGDRVAIDFDCGGEIVIAVDQPLRVPADAQLSIDGANEVTLDGGGETRILESAARARLILKGLTFRNAHRQLPSGGDERDEGGALRLGSRGETHVQDCRFFDNVAEGTEGHGGGAIYPHTGHLTVVNSTFSGNRSSLGGAIHNMLTNLTIVDSVFEDNEATEQAGGAVFTDGAYFPEGETKGFDGMIHICGSRFANNRAVGSGAAGFLFSYEHDGSDRRDHLLIESSEFRDNVLSDEKGLGGALRVDADAQIIGSTFVGNRGGGQGGGIWLGRGPMTVVNSTFLANEASQGGAIGSSSMKSQVNVLNCTFAENVGGWGGALSLSGHDYEVRNSLFAFNGEEGNGRRHCSRAPSGDGNLIFPREAEDMCGATGEGLDPLLLLPDDLSDVEAVPVAPESPAIATGSDCPPIDQAGKERPTPCTLGAVEPG